LRLCRSDEGSTRRTRLLARTFEAVVGAIFADQGTRGADRFLRRFVTREFERQGGGRPRLDAKSRLQQITQSRFEEVPTYSVTSVSGPGHDPTFNVEAWIGSVLASTASGSTKQEAEQLAASAALEQFESSKADQPEQVSGG
jgi:ribonuclease-3